MNCRCGPPDKPCFQVFSGSILRTVVLPPSTAPEHLWCPPHRSCHLSRGKAECMHASIACLLLYEDYVWVSLGNAMKAKQSNYTTKDSDTVTLQKPLAVHSSPASETSIVEAHSETPRKMQPTPLTHCLTRLCPDEQLKHCISVPTLPCLYSANGMSHRHMACTNLIAKVNGSKQARPRVVWWVGKSSRAEAVRG